MPTSFQKKVYKIVKKIPRGKTSTYKQIASILHSSPRAIGQALKRNPYKNVPCHRVIQSNGKVGGYFGKENSRLKAKILKEEGVKLK